MVQVLNWKGRREWTRPRGMGYTTPSELREDPEGAREAFPEIACEDLKVSQEEGPLDKDNPEWMPFPVKEEPYELMWTSLSSHYILRENKWVYGMAKQESKPREPLHSQTGAQSGECSAHLMQIFLSNPRRIHSGMKDR